MAWVREINPPKRKKADPTKQKDAFIETLHFFSGRPSTSYDISVDKVRLKKHHTHIYDVHDSPPKHRKGAKQAHNRRPEDYDEEEEYDDEVEDDRPYHYEDHDIRPVQRAPQQRRIATMPEPRYSRPKPAPSYVRPRPPPQRYNKFAAQRAVSSRWANATTALEI